ncbi:Histidine kinase-, DNA gyrase B-, and HSP90-like ATPase [Paenimyroides ummariense]|uniref:histidine kinase n=2 Tax=Paenimyroides ummariense TaxID=913024 RepID=A0A1I5DPY1_9FLAO|nr:Histidine kinase-, DNA gyrase B-, and HSP90-like ATPase [Paenimyroides ummariense]
MHLAHIAFPENHYKLNIQIDDYSLANTSIEFRSELIRVIQEAFTNIIKHAKASQVDLWIYREIGKLCVVIKDNGKGMASGSKQNTMGIGNMKARLKKFEADFVLNSDDTGVEITISIPENTIKRNHETADL